MTIFKKVDFQIVFCTDIFSKFTQNNHEKRPTLRRAFRSTKINLCM